MALSLAGSSWDCADAAAAAARAAAVRRGVPVNEDVQVGLVLRALWRHVQLQVSCQETMWLRVEGSPSSSERDEQAGVPGMSLRR